MKFFLKCFLTQKRLLFANTSRKTSGKLQRWSVLNSSPTLQGALKSPWRVSKFFNIINFHQSAGCPLQAASVRFQQQLPCSRLCLNELQPAAKIMLRGPRKLKWGLPSTWLTFPVSLRHILRDFNWVWWAFRDSLFHLIIKLNCCKIQAESTVHLAVLCE